MNLQEVINRHGDIRNSLTRNRLSPQEGLGLLWGEYLSHWESFCGLF